MGKGRNVLHPICATKPPAGFVDILLVAGSLSDLLGPRVLLKALPVENLCRQSTFLNSLVELKFCKKEFVRRIPSSVSLNSFLQSQWLYSDH